MSNLVIIKTKVKTKQNRAAFNTVPPVVLQGQKNDIFKLDQELITGQLREQ